MPKFNEFIKGFEEKAEAEQPKENRDQIIEKVNQKMMNAGTYGAFGDKENYEKSIAEAEELRKGLAPKAEEPKDKGTPKREPLGLKSFSDTADIDTAYGVLNNGEWKFGGNWGEKEAYDFLKNNNRKLPYTDDQLHQIAKEWIDWKEANKQKAQPAPQVQAPKMSEAPKPKKQVEYDQKKQYGNVAYWLQKAGFEPSEVNEEGGYIKVKNNEGKDYEIRGSRKPYEYNVFENGKQIYKDVPDSAVFENILSGKDLESFERYRASETPEQSPAEIASAHFGKEMTPTKWSENTFETEDGEEWFIGTEEEAREEAKNQIKSLADDMGLESFNPDFQEWILGNALDENFILQLQLEEADYFEGDGEAEFADRIRSMSLDEFADYLREYYSDKEFANFLSRNNAIDWDKVAEEAIDWDGIAHFLASYDGEEVELPNGLFGYRIN